MSRIPPIALFCSLAAWPLLAAAQDPGRDVRLEALQRQLSGAEQRVAELEATLGALAAEIALLREQGQSEGESASPIDAGSGDYADRILVADLGHDERDGALTARPELFIQSRYHANPIDESTENDVARNFGLNRMEARWAGAVSDRVGMGFEIQYHPAPDGAPEELVNDAYVEYYTSDALTLRVGQFVKPFGFDLQHSSSARESPERGVFAGYFFPGQRDRGIMLAANLDDIVSGLAVYGGVFNGNRFFNDNNGELNYNLRVRKVFDSLPLAVGASLQHGTQLVPPGVGGGADEDLYGVDIQYAVGRLGLRAEYMRGDMPSTLLSLEPEFSPAFVPGAKSSGAAVFFNYHLTPKDDVYWRWDRFEGDPVNAGNVSAFNVGYNRWVGASSRIGVDYQTKSDVTYNDDELNTKLSLTWNLIY
jgi:hypothetical protein